MRRHVPKPKLARIANSSPTEIGELPDSSNSKYKPKRTRTVDYPPAGIMNRPDISSNSDRKLQLIRTVVSRRPPVEILEISSDSDQEPEPHAERRSLLNELLRVICGLQVDDLNEELVQLMKYALRIREEQAQISCHEWAQLGVSAYTAADKFRLKELWKVATRILGHPGLNEFSV